MVNSPLYSLYVYGGRENRGEGSRRIQLRLLASRLSVGGQVYAYSQLRQLSYSQSYLQLVVKGDTAPRRYKVYLPANKASHVYHLLVLLRAEEKREEGGSGPPPGAVWAWCATRSWGPPRRWAAPSP